MISKKIKNFFLKAYNPYTPLLGNSLETGGELMGISPWLPAEVPESVYKTLLRAGCISDPFIDRNSLNCEWIPNRWWGYHAQFSFSKKASRHYRLRIDHLDYTAHLWLNHKHIGDSRNVSVPFYADITSCLEEDNELDILIEHAPTEHGQIGYTSKTHTQKPRFNYQWDWCMRMVSLGIDSPVYIEEFGEAAIESLRTEQRFDGTDCILSGEITMQGFVESVQQLDIQICFQEQTMAGEQYSVTLSPGSQTIPFSLRVPDIQLWYPNGHGEQPLYQLHIASRNTDGCCSDQRVCTIGFRSVSHLPCIGAEDALPYRVQINGKDIYLKGVNYLPPEMSQADITRERLQTILQNIANANCNLIRVWGGAYIGSQDLYEICDQLGILVWQEFTQSSSGIDNVPSKDPYFLEQLANTARAAVTRLQTHPSLLLYSGGNELTDSEGIPVDFQDTNIQLLQKIVSENDSRYMLPSSASGPNEFLDITTPGKNHDVHGPWKYEGTTKHYTIYNRSDSLLHSEFGVDGMTNYSALKRMLSPEHLVVTNMRDNLVWRHRGEWWDTYDRTFQIFGVFSPDELQDFIICSQYIQGEGLRYALEANRRRAFQNCGSIIWQYNEPCPNVSGTNLEDYYGGKKLAYYFVQDAYRPLTSSLRYDKLLWTPGENADFEATILNDSAKFDGHVLVTAKTWEGESLLMQEFSVSVPENQNLPFARFTITIPESSAISITITIHSEEASITSEYILFTASANGTADRSVAIRASQMYFN